MTVGVYCNLPKFSFQAPLGVFEINPLVLTETIHRPPPPPPTIISILFYSMCSSPITGPFSPLSKRNELKKLVDCIYRKE